MDVTEPQSVMASSREKPLLGAVLCWAAVPKDKETRLAEEMGGEHSLYLTWSVTHLLVEVSHAPTVEHLTSKYKHVAANRNDVRVLQSAWLEAVHRSWVAEKFDLRALEEDYKLPIFVGLSVCLTGFEDLTLRTQLQERIITHGGAYRGCLTSNVTHLIANAPEGRKYQCAEECHIRVVSLRWFERCIDRGMVLEESLYHPTIPLTEQGGAWNRDKAEVKLGKRHRDPDFVCDHSQVNKRPCFHNLGSIDKDRTGEYIKHLEQQVVRLNALRCTKNILGGQAVDTTVSYTSQTHLPASQTMRIQVTTLVESRPSKAKDIIDASDEDRTISGDGDSEGDGIDISKAS